MANEITNTRENTSVQTRKPNVTAQVKALLNNTDVQKRFKEVLGAKASQFMASVVNVVHASPQLQKCNPNSIMGAAFVAATFDLPIDNNLGFSAIVPYGDEAQFQMMYKGFVQLAIRSGYYEKMNCSVVYRDEVMNYNPITGELEFVSDISGCTDRESGDPEKVAGYYARFKLKTGFVHELYMTKQEVENHARKYSSAYRYDLNKNRQISPWSTNFDTMALKTVLKLLLSRWGILSIDMERAIQDDQKTFDSTGDEDYGDNRTENVIDAESVIDPFAQDEVSADQKATGTQDTGETDQTQQAAAQTPTGASGQPAAQPDQEIDLASLEA